MPTLDPSDCDAGCCNSATFFDGTPLRGAHSAQAERLTVSISGPLCPESRRAFIWVHALVKMLRCQRACAVGSGSIPRACHHSRSEACLWTSRQGCCATSRKCSLFRCLFRLGMAMGLGGRSIPLGGMQTGARHAGTALARIGSLAVNAIWRPQPG